MISIQAISQVNISKLEKKIRLQEVDWGGTSVESTKVQIDTMLKLYDMSIEIGDKYSEAKSLELIGYTKVYQRKYLESIGNFSMAAHIFDSLGFKVRAGVQKLGVANVYFNNGELSKSDSIFYSLVPLFKDSLEFNKLSITYLGLAENYMSIEELDSVDKYIKLANGLLPLYEDHFKFNEMVAVEMEGWSQHLKGNHEKSRQLYKKVIEHAILHNLKGRIFTGYRSLTKIELAQKNHQSAIELLDELKPYVVESHNFMAEVSKLKSQVYEEMGSNDSAVFYLRQFFNYSDSLRVVLNEELQHEMKVKHELTTLHAEAIKDEIEINQLNQQSKREKMVKFWVLRVLIIVLVLFGLLIHFLRKGVQRKRQLIYANQEVVNAEQDLLKSKLEAEKLKEGKLEKEIVVKNKELINFALEVARKNELSRDVLKKLKKSLKNKCEENLLKELAFYLQYNLEINKSYEELQSHVDQTNKVFLEQFKEAYPKCTPNDCHVASLIRLGLTSKEIANVKNITVASVEIARHRLRKKLGLESSINLSEFLQEV